MSDHPNAALAATRANANAQPFVLRGEFITPGSGQAITYARKEAEARAWVPGHDPATAPFLAAEAEATGISIDALAANAAISIPVNAWLEMKASSTTQWYSSTLHSPTVYGTITFLAGP